MKAQIKTNVHNRFKIEVKDTKTNEIRQKGFAENIVLNRMYTRLVNFSTFFTYIHIGGGSGTLSPDRVTLFSPITYKTATVDEKIKAYPISSVTKRITLGTTEQNGKTFTEVGISESTSAINTHALIKDAEGNPLTINKTDTDEITIYATIFFELVDNPNVDGKFSKMPTNMLANYVIDGSSMSPKLWVGDAGGSSIYNYINHRRGTYSLSRVNDVANKKNIYSTRLDVADANFDITEMTLGDIFRIDLENAQSWNGYTLQDVNIGTGDGTETTFNLGRYGTKNVSARVDGVSTTNYTLQNSATHYHYPFKEFINPESELYNSINLSTGVFAGFVREFEVGVNTPYEIITAEVVPSEIVGRSIEIRAKGQSPPIASYIISGSHDGESFATLGVLNFGENLETKTFAITEGYSYIRLEIKHNSSFYSWCYFIGWAGSEEPTITFNNPPAEGVPVTVSYSVPYIPKTKDYVLDLELELLW